MSGPNRDPRDVLARRLVPITAIVGTYRSAKDWLAQGTFVSHMVYLNMARRSVSTPLPRCVYYTARVS